MDSNTRELALELYARGCTTTRQGALYIAQHEPDRARSLITEARIGAEMRHQDDIAQVEGDDGYGHMGFAP